MALRLPCALNFALNLRVPVWAHGASLSINGKRNALSLQPGSFAAVRREWRSADRIELELPLRQSLESIDAADPETVALLAGPLVLMRMVDGDDAASGVTRMSLLAAQRDRHGSHEWRATTDAGAVKLKPFLDIDAELYSAYQTVLPS